MRKIKTLGTALLVAVIFSGSTATGAIASSFLASHTGKIFGTGRTAQRFKFTAGTLECSTVVVEGTINIMSTKYLNQAVHAQYSECTAFGFAVDNSSALLLLSADLKLSVDSDLVFNLLAAACSLLIGLSANQNLNSVYYPPSFDLKPVMSVKGITYTSTGGACGAGGNNGEYTGTILFPSVPVQWDPS